MEYVQEHVATLHAYDTPDPAVSLADVAVVVPLVGRDYATPATEGVFETLSELGPARVIVALRAEPARVGEVADWLSGFDLSLSVLWCNAPALEATLAEAGLNGEAGKGRDVWLALGVASTSEYVVVHDADAHSYDRTQVPRLVFPLQQGYSFSKGYYARIENDKLYGRLCRLFVVPLIEALAAEDNAAILPYLRAFRYPLAGECAMTGDLARTLRVPRGWGLELGTLGDAFLAGREATAQVDLGMHEHSHRAVSGPDGLGNMAREVGETLFTVVEEHGVSPEYETLPARYRDVANRLIAQYETDAAFNGLEYDTDSERTQVDHYSDAIAPPGSDDRLPAWADISLDPALIAERSQTELERVCGPPTESVTHD